MRAATREQTGPPEAIKLGDLPRPRLATGLVLVKLGAPALNPIDLDVRSGAVPIAPWRRATTRPGRSVRRIPS
jgi:NADPH:quinone reductase-like Zn-dependent oxidoreductase